MTPIRPSSLSYSSSPSTSASSSTNADKMFLSNQQTNKRDNQPIQYRHKSFTYRNSWVRETRLLTLLFPIKYQSTISEAVQGRADDVCAFPRSGSFFVFLQRDVLCMIARERQSEKEREREKKR